MSQVINERKEIKIKITPIRGEKEDIITDPEQIRGSQGHALRIYIPPNQRN